jgi:hypothetical protein
MTITSESAITIAAEHSNPSPHSRQAGISPLTNSTNAQQPQQSLEPEVTLKDSSTTSPALISQPLMTRLTHQKKLQN